MYYLNCKKINIIYLYINSIENRHNIFRKIGVYLYNSNIKKFCIYNMPKTKHVFINNLSFEFFYGKQNL